MKVLLSSFHLSGHPLEFHPQTSGCDTQGLGTTELMNLIG